MAVYIQAPKVPDWDSLDEYRAIFLAGEITLPSWQDSLVERLSETGLVILNPVNLSLVDEHQAIWDQVSWEYIEMRSVDSILFWFPKEKECSISLYELGVCSEWDKRIFVGIEPGYRHAQDIEIRMSMARPDVNIVYSLDKLAAQVLKWADTN